MSETIENIANLLKRVFMFLEDEEWDNAIAYCEKILDCDPENTNAYLGKLLASLKLKSIDDLENCEVSFEDNKDYKKIVRFGDKDTINTLNDHLERIKKQIEINLQNLDKKRAKNIVEFSKLRERNKHFSAMLSASGNSSVAAITVDNEILHNSKYVDVTGVKISHEDWIDVSTIKICGGYLVGIKQNGTLVTAGKMHTPFTGTPVSKWENISSVCLYDDYIFGIKKDGSVVACGKLSDNNMSVCNWKNIINLYPAFEATIGLKRDGTIIHTDPILEPWISEVEGWTGIIDIAFNTDGCIGLKEDGTIVTTSLDPSHYSFDNWEDIIAIDCGDEHFVALKADGTLVATGDAYYEACEVTTWKNILAIACVNRATIGLKSDGTLVHTPVLKLIEECNMLSSWRLFKDVNNLENERNELFEKKKQISAWKNENKCQHCGGDFIGFFSKKCCSCDRKKDY